MGYKPLPVGVDNFEKLITRGYYFIDKTLLIKELLDKKGGGTGRSDLYIRPVTRRKEAFVMEFKVAGNFREMEKKAEEALKQIEDRQYVRELNDDGYAKVGRYGIAFFGKDCLVRMV